MVRDRRVLARGRLGQTHCPPRDGIGMVDDHLCTTKVRSEVVSCRGQSLRSGELNSTLSVTTSDSAHVPAGSHGR